MNMGGVRGASEDATHASKKNEDATHSTTRHSVSIYVREKERGAFEDAIHASKINVSINVSKTTNYDKTDKL